jgi:hypothetical protein
MKNKKITNAPSNKSVEENSSTPKGETDLREEKTPKMPEEFEEQLSTHIRMKPQSYLRKKRIKSQRKRSGRGEDKAWFI